MSKPLPDAISGTATAPARRFQADAWQTIVPTGFVIAVLVVLVLLPVAHGVFLDNAREQIWRFADPARAEVTTIHLALALEGSLVNDYFDTRDSALAGRLREEVRQEEDATRRLGELVVHLDDSVQARYAEMRRLQVAWRHAAERGIARLASDGRRPPDALRQEEYGDLLLTVARLDQAIGLDIQRNRARILSTDRVARWTTAVLALAGLAGVGAVAFLGRRARLYAVQLERQRAELERQHAALERAVDGRARLMRGVSHDLRNPLHSIDGHAALIADGIVGPLTAAQQDGMARIRRGVRSLLGLVDDLLELARAEGGQLKVSPQPTDLTPLLRETVEEHCASGRAAGHELELSVGSELPSLRTDPERVRQVLGNLLSNAVKYTPSGGHITVRAERRPRGVARDTGPPEESVAIDVVDTGPGIPADKLEAIFDEFSRLPGHAEKPGVGLGLAIARRVARLLGGDLTAGNAPHGGARFTLWLPVRSDA